MRRSGQPSRPSAMTCCRFSSLKTLLTSMEGNPSIVLNVLPISIGRFSAVPHWPVLGVPREGAKIDVCRTNLPGWNQHPVVNTRKTSITRCVILGGLDPEAQPTHEVMVAPFFLDRQPVTNT